MDSTESPNHIILKILDIIDFQEDKDAFVDEFNEIFSAAVLIKLLESLPEDERTTFQKELVEETEPEKIQRLIEEKFSDQQKADAHEKAMAETMTSFLENISSELPEDKKKELDTYLESILPPEEK